MLVVKQYMKNYTDNVPQREYSVTKYSLPNGLIWKTKMCLQTTLILTIAGNRIVLSYPSMATPIQINRSKLEKSIP